MNVETVLTHDQLANAPGLGPAALANILAKSFGGSSATVREEALRLTLKTLSRRSPPIWEESISDPTELRDAVMYGALEIIYGAAMTTAGVDSIFAMKRKTYDDRFKAELQGLQPTVSDGVRAPAGLGIVMERR
jgi:hypothetical protein